MDEATVVLPSRRVVLSEAIAAGELPTWTETVAIVRAITLHVQRSATPLHIPSLGDVSVLASGAVHVDGGRPYPTGPIPGLGMLMGQLLDRGVAPPPVLDIQRQTQADPPVFQSLTALHSALEYFARPDANAVLADYYSRASAAIEHASERQALDELKEKAKHIAVPDERKRESRARVVPRWVFVVAALVVLGLAATLVAYIYSARNPSPGGNTPAAAALNAITETTKKVSEAATSAISALVGGPTTSAPTNESANVSPPAPPPVKTAASRPKTDKPAVAAPPPVQGSAEAKPSPTPAAVVEDQSAPPPTVDMTIYSASDPSVQRPELLYQQMPTRMPGGIYGGEPGTLEIIVLEDGTVGEARLIPMSDRIQDRMLISAAKAWRFRPAVRDGRPVRYKISVKITW